MAQDSKIQWTDHTWNIAVGCSKVDADCKYCYMYRQSLNSTRYKPDEVRKTKTVFNLPLKIKEPSRIFTSSLTDVFHPDCDAFRNEMWDIIRKCPQHTFQILTKRPERIEEHLPEDWGLGWSNVWLGTSVGSQASASRILELSRLGGGNHKLFLSIEPLHDAVWLEQVVKDGYLWNVLDGIPYSEESEEFVDSDKTYPIDWVIIGGESGNENGKYKYRPCKLEWIEHLVNECKFNRVPVFVKQLGTHLAKEMGLKDRHGGNIDEWPEHLKVREFPKV